MSSEAKRTLLEALSNLRDREVVELARTLLATAHRAAASRRHFVLSNVGEEEVTVHLHTGQRAVLGRGEQLAVEPAVLEPRKGSEAPSDFVYLSHAIVIGLTSRGDATVRLDASALPPSRAGAIRFLLYRCPAHGAPEMLGLPPGGSTELITPAGGSLQIVGTGYSVALAAEPRA